MPYGGDYYPEQWDRETWKEDMRLFKLAGIDWVSLNIFAWTLSQSDDNKFHFEWLDEVIDYVEEHGLNVCLGTGTAAHPAWMARKHPDILRTEFSGMKRKFGGRHNSCPSSPSYRHFSTELAGKLAERYKNRKSIVLWHVSNEYGGACYCENCEKAFRVWLKSRYKTVEGLNAAWKTKFWNHIFLDWDDVVAPNVLSEQWSERGSSFQSISLDYQRFMSDALLDCYKLEYDAIRKHMPKTPITTNLMGFYKPLDYQNWAKHMDVITWDNYPAIDTPRTRTSMAHDMMRGLRQGQSFLLMEQTPSQQNWQPYNSLKRPGVMRLWSYQAIAHGADSVLFFQMRRSTSACEKYHGAVIEHVGHENTRVFREIAELGAELKTLGKTFIESRVDAQVALWFDWQNWWAAELSSGPSIALNYVEEAHRYYDAFNRAHFAVDMAGPDSDLSKYKILVAPIAYLLREESARKIEAFVQAGGTFVATFFSGIVDENDRVVLGGYPGHLRKILGVWAEEIDALPPDQRNAVVMKGSHGALKGSYECSLLFDLIHCETAKPLATYGKDFYAGMPALTRNEFGKGRAYYVATHADEAFHRDLALSLTSEAGLKPVVDGLSEDVEALTRSKDGKTWLFLLNHSPESRSVKLGANVSATLIGPSAANGKFELPGYGVSISELG